MERAKIYVLDDKGNKIKEKTIEVMFNPTEYKHSLNVGWEGKNGTIPQFTGSNFENLSIIDLWFDAYESGKDVREDHEINVSGKVRKIAGTKRIAELTIPSVSGKESKHPPVCLFSWGKFNFKCVMQKVTVNFIMFLSDGTPVRAKVTIEMKPVMDARDILKMQGVDACRKVRSVIEGERLDIIAAEELKDPSLWRKIAETNNISDPLNFPSSEDIGRIIIIPD